MTDPMPTILDILRLNARQPVIAGEGGVIGYIDRTLSNVGAFPEVDWTSGEVVELLEDIRELIEAIQK